MSISNSNQTEISCSVCIANYNGENVIEACLDSVFGQDCSFPIEVIVHDDASSDGSIKLIREKYPAVRLLRSEKNVGFCISNNRMVDVAKGKFILLLNNDAELHKNSISTLYNYAIKKNIYGILGLSQYSMETGELIDIGSLLDPFLNPIPNRNRLRYNVGMVIGACLWLPKQLWMELGGFPEWFGSLAEDMYLCCRARLKGYPVVVLAESGFNHWVGRNFGGGKVIRNQLQTTYRRRALSERNKNYVMFLCYPAALACTLIPIHLLLLAMEGLILSVVKNDRHIWKYVYQPCFSSFWRHRIKLLRMRREIQTERKASLMAFYSAHTILPHKLTMLLKHGLPTLK